MKVFLLGSSFFVSLHQYGLHIVVPSSTWTMLRVLFYLFRLLLLFFFHSFSFYPPFFLNIHSPFSLWSDGDDDGSWAYEWNFNICWDLIGERERRAKRKRRIWLCPNDFRPSPVFLITRLVWQVFTMFNSTSRNKDAQYEKQTQTFTERGNLWIEVVLLFQLLLLLLFLFISFSFFG